MILDDETRKIHHTSACRPADPLDLNLSLEPLDGERDPIVKSFRLPPEADSTTSDNQVPQTTKAKSKMTPTTAQDLEKALNDPNVIDPSNSGKPIVIDKLPNGERAFPFDMDPNDFVGRTFLVDDKDSPQRLRARVIQAIDKHDAELGADQVKFKIAIGDDEWDDLLTYGELMDYIEDQEQEQILWRYKRIIAHQGPIKPGDPDYNGSTYNVLIEWENGEQTYEPLRIVAKDDPVTCAIYAKDNNLLDTPGWRSFKRLAMRTKKFIRAVNQAKLRSYNNAPRYKYGFEVPRDYAHAMRIDQRNGNNAWQMAVDTEMRQLDEYDTFHNHGRIRPPGYKQIRVHLVFDVKHDGRLKARCVADGHLTDIPLESVYSGVVTMRGARMVAYLADHFQLELYQTDIGNAYLEAKTSEKLYIIAGDEFGKERKGCVLVIHKALYGLRTSGKQWHIRFSECLTAMNFFPSRGEPDIWMRKTKNKHGEDVYEYVAVYVDDLMMAMVDPEAFVLELKRKYQFKFKGTGPIEFHLGMNFTRDEKTGIRTISSQKYVTRMMEEYKRHFGSYPKKNVRSPLPDGDHPELDTSELLDSDKVTLFQSMVGSLQWCVTIGRLDIFPAVMSLSSMRAAPRQGHLERAQRIYSYLRHMDQAAITIWTDLPDYSALPEVEYEWTHTVYGTRSEELPQDAPIPLGKSVILTHYVDANLMHNILTGRSVTGVLHFINKTPIDWYCKKQATVETATFGSELVAARTATEQIKDLRNTLRYLGVRVDGPSYLFGDNKTVVDVSTVPHAKLNKRHTILSFHRVREAMATGMIKFYHIAGAFNPADILSKNWAYSSVWPSLKPLLF